MSVKVARWATRNSRCRGNKFLALYALASKADNDGLYWPFSWDEKDARVRKNGVLEAIRALNKSGEVIQVGAGHTVLFWITIAFTPREMKEIAMRRFWMNERQATALVTQIVSQQLN